MEVMTITTIYLIRHSKPLKVNNNYSQDNLQMQNEKNILGIEGEQIAKERLTKDLFASIDSVYSSNYVRAVATAKYIAEKNNLTINIDNDLGERKFGISSWEKLPENFEKTQFLDENYKLESGESQKEVRERMLHAIMKILNENRNKKVAIISHGTAITYLLKKWCDIEIVDDKLRYSFKNNILLDGYFNYCETFKLNFDEENNLINIENIKYA